MYAPPFLPSPEGGVGVVGVFDATLECIPTTLPTTDVAPQAVWYRPTIFMVGTQLRRSPKANWGTWTPVNSCSSHNQCAVRAVGRIVRCSRRWGFRGTHERAAIRADGPLLAHHPTTNVAPQAVWCVVRGTRVRLHRTTTTNVAPQAPPRAPQRATTRPPPTLRRRRRTTPHHTAPHRTTPHHHTFAPH